MRTSFFSPALFMMLLTVGCTNIKTAATKNSAQVQKPGSVSTVPTLKIRRGLENASLTEAASGKVSFDVMHCTIHESNGGKKEPHVVVVVGISSNEALKKTGPLNPKSQKIWTISQLQPQLILSMAPQNNKSNYGFLVDQATNKLSARFESSENQRTEITCTRIQNNNIDDKDADVKETPEQSPDPEKLFCAIRGKAKDAILKEIDLKSLGNHDLGSVEGMQFSAVVSNTNVILSQTSTEQKAEQKIIAQAKVEKASKAVGVAGLGKSIQCFASESDRLKSIQAKEADPTKEVAEENLVKKDESLETEKKQTNLQATDPETSSKTQ